jgi:hypothetical protein
MDNKKIYIRQGDILFEKVNSIDPNDKEPLETKTVALGEITNHHHSFTKNVKQVLLYKQVDEDMPSQATVLENGPQLTHQEHLSIQFPKGEYRIRREQSYNPFLKQIQRSVD